MSMTSVSVRAFTGSPSRKRRSETESPSRGASSRGWWMIASAKSGDEGPLGEDFQDLTVDFPLLRQTADRAVSIQTGFGAIFNLKGFGTSGGGKQTRT